MQFIKQTIQLITEQEMEALTKIKDEYLILASRYPKATHEDRQNIHDRLTHLKKKQCFLLQNKDEHWEVVDTLPYKRPTHRRPESPAITR